MMELAVTFSSWYFVIGGSLLAVLLLLGVVVAPWVRRKYHPSSIGGSHGQSAFDIDSLERMRSEGLITDEEFRKLRRAALGLDVGAAKADNSTSSAPGGGDDEESDLPTESRNRQAGSKSADPGQEASADEGEPE